MDTNRKTRRAVGLPLGRIDRRHSIGPLVLLLGLLTVMGQAQISPSDDAYVNSAAPSTNYGAATTLNLQSAADTAFIRFDLTAVPAGYTGGSIAKATLKLYVNSATTAGSFNIDYVIGTWAEKTITYSLQPAIGTTIAASVPLTTASKGKYVEIDVTAAVVEWLNGTQANDGIALVANSPLVATFDSKENTSASHAPELDLVFAGIAGITTASGSGLTGGGASGTLNLSLLTTCAANQVLQWNGTAWACASTGTGTVTSVGSGLGLTGGPITGTGALSIANGGVTNAMLAANSVTSANIADGSLNPTKVAGTSAILGSNNFAGNQTILGSLTVAGAFPGGSTLVGKNTDTTSNSNTNGVFGSSAAPAGNGVLGIASAKTGFAYGVVGGTVSSDSGVGVYGYALNGTSFGMEGVSFSATGTAGAFWNSANGDIIRGYNSNGIVFSVNNAGSVGIGNATPAVKLDILGQDASLRVRNSNALDLNAEVGGFMGNTYDNLEMGLFNLSATTTHGILAPQESRSLFGMDLNGHVGSLTNDYANGPGYRNLLDDGAGNATIAATLTAGVFSGNGMQLTGQITSYNGTPTAANGVPSIVLQNAFSSNGSGSNSFTNLFTPSNDSIFRITAFQECTATSAGNTYFSLAFFWTLPTGGKVYKVVGGQNCAFLNGSAGSIVAHVKGGTAIQYNYAGMDAPFQTTILVEQLL